MNGLRESGPGVVGAARQGGLGAGSQVELEPALLSESDRWAGAEALGKVDCCAADAERAEGG